MSSDRTAAVEMLEDRTLLNAPIPPQGMLLVWSRLPQTAIAGQHVTVVVKQYGYVAGFNPRQGIVRNWNSPVQFYQSSNATVGAPILGVAPMVDGVSVFSSLSFKTAGSYTITAAASQNGAAPAPPVQITVLPASARRMSIISFQPAGSGFAHFEVELQDRFGNLASGDESTLRFRLSPHVAGITAYVYPDLNTELVNPS